MNSLAANWVVQIYDKISEIGYLEFIKNQEHYVTHISWKPFKETVDILKHHGYISVNMDGRIKNVNSQECIRAKKLLSFIME